MFTGLVQALGRIKHAKRGAGGVLRLVVTPPKKSNRGGGLGYQVKLGDSVAVSGVCLTVADDPASHSGDLVFHAVQETLDKTTLGMLKAGAGVNLEPAMRADGMLGGHIVQGHVDGVGKVTRVQRGADWRVWVDLPQELLVYSVPKGSVTIDGVSLTIAGVTAKGLWAALIPTTLQKTTLGRLSVGDRVNVEMDVITKTVVRTLEHHRLGKGGRRRVKRARTRN